MPPTQPSNPNTIDIYRNMKFTYDQGLVGTTVDCKCPCETDDNVNNCAPVEKLFLYGVRPSPVKELYNYFKDEKFKQEDGYTVTEADGKREFPDDSWSKSTGNEILNIDQQGKILDESGFEKWQGIMNQFTSACVICEKIKSIVESNKNKTDIEQTLAGLNEAYNSKRTAYSTDLDTLIEDINAKKTQFEANQETIRQQQKKIRLAHKLLNAQADKLKTFGQQFTSLQTQYKERHLDRVSFGLPYLKPIYTMSSRQFFVLMVVLNIVLVVVIGVYGFYPRNQKSEANQTKEWACVTHIFFLVWPIIEFPPLTMYSAYEGFQAQRATDFDDNVETLLQSTQQKFDKHMRKVTALSYEVETSRSSGNIDEDKVKALHDELNNNVYPIIASLQALQQKYETKTNASRSHFNENNTLWSTTSEMEDTNTRIQDERQKFESVKALSTQSLELYRHQNNVMWMNIGLFVLLVAGAAYLYYYVHSMSGDSHSLTNLPANPKELMDNNYVTHKDLLPQEKPIEAGSDESSLSSSTEEWTKSERIKQRKAMVNVL